MTAEIAIANKSAVALAADSKVTIGGGRNAKTYDTVNKVFTLSKSFPVGIMIFGNAEFMRYPWETIIKLYRRERGGTDKARVADWSADFQEYLKKFGRIDDHHRGENIRAICGAWLYRLEEVAENRAIEEGIPIPSDAYQTLLLTTVRDRAASVAGAEPWLTKGKQRTLLKTYGDVIVQAVNDVYSVDPDSELFRASLEFCAAALIMKVDSPLSSGFVIAGFGADEFFPTIIEHTTDGYVGANLKIKVEKPYDICRSNPSYVGAFAQKDMVQSFMNGFDTALISKMTGGLREMVQDSCLTVLETYGLKSKRTDTIRDQVKHAASARVNEVVKDLLNQSKERFSGPVVQMVGLLPKDELAHLAESLVALTSLRRRVSRETETVGGPVDVALISKGDGFVWIKRKHYFRPEDNPQFVQNYMNDVSRS